MSSLKNLRTMAALFLTSLMLLGSACNRPTAESGFVGTWTRGNDRITTTIEIYEDQTGTWWFRWLRESVDNRADVRCEWGNPCEEIVDGQNTSTYEFTVWMDDETGHLMVRQDVEVWYPKELKMIVEDELVLEPDGLSLWSYTHRRGDDRFEGEDRPKRKLEKVSNTVSNPPPVL